MMELSDKELSVIENTSFLLTKIKVTEKIQQLLGQTRLDLKVLLSRSVFEFPEGSDLTTGKISKGENYQNLPYLVLDYPKLFTQKDIFAYRTMFWWGNFFSATLHLQGHSLEKHRSSFMKNLSVLIDQDIYIGVGSSPWQYHYETDNYIPVSEIDADFIRQCEFLKLSKKIPLSQWSRVPPFSTDFFAMLIALLEA